MFQRITCRARLLSMGAIVFFLSSCRQQVAESSMSGPDNYPQPVTTPLQFTEPRKLTWINTHSTAANPVSIPLNLDQLPALPYDTLAPKKFIQAPEVKLFNMQALSGKAFDLERQAAIPIVLIKTTLAPPAVGKPTLVPISHPAQRSAFDWLTLQGMAGKYISCMFRDEAGFIWLATEKGLSRYDGEYLMTYDVHTSHETVDGICQDQQGRLWLVSDHGLTVVDIQHGMLGKSDKIKTNTSENAAMLRDDIGRIWLCNTVPLGVNVIDPVAGTFKNLTVASGFLESVDWDASGVQEDKHHNIWIAHSRGALEIYNTRTGVVKFAGKGNGMENNSSLVKGKNDSGIIWISSLGGILNRIDAQQGTVSIYNAFHGLSADGIADITVDSSGRIWVIGSRGLTIMDPQKKEYRHIATDPWIEAHLLVDERNRVWLYGPYQGLAIIDQSIIHQPTGALANAVAVDSEGGVWSTTLGKGLALTNPEKNTRRFLTEAQGLGSNSVGGLIEKNGKILAVTDKTLDIIDPQQKKIQQAVIRDVITTIYPDRKGHFWYSGLQYGVSLADTNQHWIKFTNRTGGLSDNLIESIAEDAAGQIWVATYFAGIDVINPERGTVKYLNKEPGIADSCSKILLPDQSGRMWIGTCNGLFVADSKKQTLVKFTTREGLPDNRILSLSTLDGVIIVGTINNVTRIKPPENDTTTAAGNWEVRLVQDADKLAGNYFMELVDNVRKDGMLRRWGSDVSMLPINRPDNNRSVMYVTALQIMTFRQHFTNNGQGLPPADRENPVEGLHWDSVTGPYNMPVNLTIPYNENLLQFQYGQAHFGRLDTTWYCSMLEGKDSSWTAITNNTFSKSYLNLSPGHYVFKVAGRLTGGQWSQPALFGFTITPPWWQTPGFRLFLLIFLLTFGWLIVKYFYNRQLAAKNKQLEQELVVQNERMRISTEMHDDIGAGLFGINLQTELLKNIITEPEIADRLFKIHQAIGQISSKVREVIWSLNKDNDNLNNVISFIHQQAHRKFENSLTRLSVISPPDLPPVDITGDKRRQIYLIINEALNNILKHAEATMAEIDFRLWEKELAIIIKDNGRGFIDDIKSPDKIGLRSMRERVQKLYGKLKLSSGPEGTVFDILIPVL